MYIVVINFVSFVRRDELPRIHRPSTLRNNPKKSQVQYRVALNTKKYSSKMRLSKLIFQIPEVGGDLPYPLPISSGFIIIGV